MVKAEVACGRGRFILRPLTGGESSSPQGIKTWMGVVVDSWRCVVLLCEECGEKVVLGGPESVWRSARSIFFECECGQLLTLTDREDGAQTRSERLVGRLR